MNNALIQPLCPSRRLFVGMISTLVCSEATRAQFGSGLPGMVCGPFDFRGVQVCTTGIPTAEIETVLISARVGIQRQSQWCWAACLEMIFRYHGMSITQEQIVYETFGELIDRPASKEVILAAVNRLWRARGLAYRVQSDFVSVSPDVAAWELGAKTPLIVGTLGHAMVLTAMSYHRGMNGQGIPFELIVRDPSPGRGRRPMSFNEVFGLNEQNGGICLRIRVTRI